MPAQAFYQIEPLLPHLEQGWTVLTPNLRLARRIKQQWDALQQQRGLRSWPQVCVYAMEHWLAQQWQQGLARQQLPLRQVLDGAQEALLWRRCISRWQGEYPAAALLTVDSAVQSAAQARQTLLRWQLHGEHPDLRRYSQDNADLQAFQHWRQDFEQALERAGWFTQDDCAVALLSLPKQEQPPVLLVDFDDLPPLHEAVVKHRASAVEYFELDAKLKPITTQAFAERDQELRAAAYRAQQSAADSGARVAIVLLDMAADRARLEYHLRCAFDCLDQDYAELPVNFSTGIRLAQAPVVRDALRLLQLQFEDKPLTAICQLLQSRFLCFGEDLQARDALINKLYQLQQAEISVRQLRVLAQEAADKMPGHCAALALAQISQLRLHSVKVLPSQWLEPVCTVLELAGWPGTGSLDSLEYQQVEQWYQLLERFCGYDDLCGELAFSEAVHCLSWLSEQQLSQPQTGDSQIQVLGPLEAAGQQFDQLLLCGAQANSLPSPARPNPFLPLQLQRERQMPHASAEREWQYSSKLLNHFRRNSEQVIASFSWEVSGSPALPSGLIPSLEQGEVIDVSPRSQQWYETVDLAWVDSAQAPSIPAQAIAQVRGGTALLDDQASCPFRSFARHRLGLASMPEESVGLSAAERGSLLHQVLDVVWRELGDSAGLARCDRADVITTAVDAVMAELPPRLRQRVGNHCLALEQSRLKQLLLEWLSLEAQRPPFTVIKREASEQVDIAGLPLQLRIDRVDALENGEVLLIDYKSSSSNTLSHWFEVPLRSPQLPLYAQADAKVRGVAWAQLKARDCSFRGLADVPGIRGINADVEKANSGPGEIHNWADLMQQWQRGLNTLAEQFISGVADIAPRSGACTYCEFSHLCRVDVSEAQ